jgi:hypothetical protein
VKKIVVADALVKKIRGTTGTVSGTTPNTLLGNYKKYTLIYIVKVFFAFGTTRIHFEGIV